MWNYDESKKAYTNENQVLKFYRILIIKTPKNGKLRNVTDTRHRIYIEIYTIDQSTSIGGDSIFILEKIIKGEGMETYKKIEAHENKIMQYALNNYGIKKIIWKR